VERRKMRARGVEVAGQGPFIEGEGVGCLLFDWLGWVAAHLIVGVVERQVLQEKKVRRKVAGRNCHANIIGRLHSCQIQVNNVRKRHNINVYRPRYDVEKIISMSDFDNDKNRSICI
jgi:hypothetical protein